MLWDCFQKVVYMSWKRLVFKGTILCRNLTLRIWTLIKVYKYISYIVLFIGYTEWFQTCVITESYKTATNCTLGWESFVNCCFQGQEWTLNVKSTLYVDSFYCEFDTVQDPQQKQSTFFISRTPRTLWLDSSKHKIRPLHFKLHFVRLRGDSGFLRHWSFETVQTKKSTNLTCHTGLTMFVKFHRW